MQLGHRLAQLRQARGIAQKDFAKLVGMAPSQVSRYEHGGCCPGIRNLERLASALRVRVSDLFW